MKDNKFYPLLTISIVLLLASFILLCILGYNFYTRAKQEKVAAALVTKKSNLQASGTKDSLQKLYTATINKLPLDDRFDTLYQADSVKLNLDTKLTDFFKLRNEISDLLKGNTSAADLDLAKQKIGELQQKIDELKNRNVDIENENRRLNAMLAQYLTNKNVAQIVRQSENINQSTIEKNPDPFFVASELHLAANNENNNEVSDADATEKFTGSFAVKNSGNLNNAELMIVVVQPDGRILKNAWESGSFDTNEGKKVYSRKIKFDYTKGEIKRLNFTLDTDKAQKGNYIMQVYNKGKIIGKVIKTVS